MSETQAEQFQTVADKFQDRWWRLNNLYYIKDITGKKVKFKPNWAQTALFRDIWYFNVILKARQLGFSTFICIYILDACIWNDDFKCGIIDASLPDAKKKLEKIKYAYNLLPNWLKDRTSPGKWGAEEIDFDNGSGVVCGTSHRGDTLQILHVSEFGKTSARDPLKAVEIKTGALNAVHAGQQIFIESTAEGQEGEFYELVQSAKALHDAEAHLTILDPKFHFFSWFDHPGYKLSEEDCAHTTITKEMAAYFHKLSTEHGIELTPGQKSWYVKKEVTQGDLMKREFPSTPEEAFEASMEGLIYSKEFKYLRKNKRIGFFPYEPSLSVSTWWDIGLNDEMAIWFMQHVGLEYRFIHYHEAVGEGWNYYLNYMQGLGYGISSHNWPHDGNKRQHGAEILTSKQQAQGVGIRPIHIVDRTKDVMADIRNHCRPTLMRCTFDEAGCADGLKHLSSGYRKEWDEKRGCFKDWHFKNRARNAADAFRTFAMGDKDRKMEMIGGFEYQVPQAQKAESDYDEFEH